MLYMNDPHIDLDEIDAGVANPQSKPGENEPENPHPYEATGYDFGNLFATMTRQFQHWTEDFNLLPTETAKHLRASQREFLLAWRSLIDHSIERLDRQDTRGENRPANGTNVGNSNKIQVEEFDD